MYLYLIFISFYYKFIFIFFMAAVSAFKPFCEKENETVTNDILSPLLPVMDKCIKLERKNIVRPMELHGHPTYYCARTSKRYN